MASQEDITLMAHLLRRAGFGASRAEIEAKAAQGYDATVAALLNPETQPAVEEDLMLRYNPVYNHSANIQTNVQQWVYRMINNPRQLQEKMSLFWHMIFCAGHSKIDSGEEMVLMTGMFREHGMGNFRDLLMRLSTSPAMLYYLDNTESHKVAINENYGRELLELFSLGVGKDEVFNYTEDDVKACARAFTGWNNAPAYPPFPYGRSPWQFRPHGRSGKYVSDLLPNLAGCVDEMCFVHSLTSKTNTHGPGEVFLSTGFTLEGFPSAGSWVSYALGSDNADLPAFVAIPDPRGVPQIGPANWSAGFLPAVFQGTAFSADRPLANLRPPGPTPGSMETRGTLNGSARSRAQTPVPLVKPSSKPAAGARRRWAPVSG